MTTDSRQPDAPAKPRIFQRLDRTASRPYPKSDYVRKAWWRLVQATLFRLVLPRGARWRVFWLRRFGARVRGGVRRTVTVWHPWLFTMGEYSLLADNVTVYNLGEVVIGAHTVISQDAYLCAGTHDFKQPDMPLLRPTIRVGSGVWICAGAFIGPGVTIGDNAIVGARAVVMRDVPAGMIVAGNPARVVAPRRMPEVELEGEGRSRHVADAERIDTDADPDA